RKTKLDFDNGSWVPIDATYRQLQSMYNMWWPQPFDMSIYTDGHDANPFDTGFGWVTGMGAACGSGAMSNLSLNHAPTFGRTELIQVAGAGGHSETSTSWLIWMQGMMPHH
ncbi:unnamed protein product, partial [marine sediment metagenome]